MGKPIHYIQFLGAFLLAQGLSMWGQYFTLKYPHMGMLESFLRAIPWAWADWVFMTIAIGLGAKYDLVTPTQDTFLLIIWQFILIIGINKYYLKQKITRSDIITFFIILVGFFISFNSLISKILGIKIPKKVKEAKHPGIKSTRNTSKKKSKDDTYKPDDTVASSDFSPDSTDNIPS